LFNRHITSVFKSKKSLKVRKKKRNDGELIQSDRASGVAVDNDNPLVFLDEVLQSDFQPMPGMDEDWCFQCLHARHIF
jgi:hypothetical protein